MTINAGVTVALNSFTLMVNGTLQAIGTISNPITFNGGQIKFTQYSTNWIESAGTGCIIQNAVVSSGLTLCGSTMIANSTLTGGITVGDKLDMGKGTPTICNNIIRGQGISLPDSDNVAVYDNTISGCSEAGIGATVNGWNNNSLICHNLIVNNTRGIEIWVSTGIQYDYNYNITNNTITNNTIGIALYENWAPEPVLTTIENNNIYANSLYNLDLGSTSLGIPYNINVNNNWWGTTDAQAISSTVYDYYQNYNLGKASFNPSLTAPNTAAPTYIAASAGNGGSITPFGIITLKYGDTQAFKITPNSGYHVLGVTVNGTSVGAVTSYTVQNIGGATTISAIFAPDQLPASGPTQVSGVIKSNSTWYKANSPYNLTENVLVNNGVILTIEAGTTVNLNGYCLEVNGTLVAKGNYIDQINFNDGYQSEEGIIFDPASNSWNQKSGTGSIIAYAMLDSVGIFCQGAEPKINSNLFYVSGKYSNPPYAIFILGSSSNPAMIIANNTFGSGYTLSTIEISQGTPIITSNNFVGKSAYNIDLWYYTPDVNATYNWWGTTDTQAINQTINDYKNNFQFGTVTFVPFLNGPSASAPVYNLPLSPTPSPIPTRTFSPTPTSSPTPRPTTNPTSNPTPKPTSSSSPTPQPQNAPLLEVSCRSSTSYSNFKVDITGSLRSNNGIAIPNAHILLSYSVNDGYSWIDLTTAGTDDNGGFSIVWNAQVTGSYLVKAIFDSNSELANATKIVNLVVTPFQQENVFSVTSNSTVTSFYFNSTSNQLSFSTNGTSGTTGYVDIYIPQSMVADASNLKVSLDGTPLTYAVTAQNDAWLVSFTYHQSSHQVTINLDSNVVAETGSSQLVIVGVVAAVVAIMVVAILVWQRKNIKR